MYTVKSASGYEAHIPANKAARAFMLASRLGAGTVVETPLGKILTLKKGK